MHMSLLFQKTRRSKRLTRQSREPNKAESQAPSEALFVTLASFHFFLLVEYQYIQGDNPQEGEDTD